jgi:hypothetical protein
MSHEHRDYLESNLPAMRDIWVDFVWKGKTATTQLLNGEGMALWYIITERIANNLLYMSLDAMSEATGISVQGVRKRLAAFGEAGWLIDLGFQKHGKYAKTKTYEVILDVLGVGHLTHPPTESKGGASSGSHGGSHGGAHGGAHGGSRNDASPTEITESSPNPIPNTNPTPIPKTHESEHNIESATISSAGEGNTRNEIIRALCIASERNNTSKPIGKPLEARLHREYEPLIEVELQCREWQTDGQIADICIAKRNGRTPPTYARPTCSTCRGCNRDIDGLEGLSTIWEGSTYVICPKCDGDGYASIKSITQKMFTNLNTKGKTQ